MIMKAGFLICAVFLSLNGWCQEPEKSPVMSDAYWALWNDDVQRKIDEDIDRYRKADAAVAVPGAAVGTEITVEQMTHDFVFGANIFNFNQLGTAERNRRYKALFGRSEEHTSELQSLMRISYAEFCLKQTQISTTPYNKSIK